MSDAAGRTAVTTPSGHVYVEPTTVGEIRKRLGTYAQGVVEGWPEEELPPPPTWAMLTVLLQAVDAAAPETLATALDRTQAEVLQLAGRLDGFEERLAQYRRIAENMDALARRVHLALGQ